MSTLTYWVIISVLLHDLVTWALAMERYWVAWRVRGRQQIAAWRLERFLPGARALGRFCFYIGIPYLALIQGVVSPRLMGLRGTPVAGELLTGPLTLIAGILALDWAGALGMGSLLAAVALVLLVWFWWRYQRLVSRLPVQRWRGASAATTPAYQPLDAAIAALRQPWGWAHLLLQAVYLETHWAFYRAWAMDLLRDDPAGATMGAFLGLIVVGLEWYGDVGLRARLRTLAGVEDWVLVASLAWISTFLFVQIGNLWLLVVVHWLLAWGVLAALGWLRQQRLSPG
ncbi:MAG: hypothetical protein KKB13_12355 [Chloroflexi bacterium]|nr:hypothetical protein [Chloroflexota bacterium]